MATPTVVNTTLPIDSNGRAIPVPRTSQSRVNLTAGSSSSNAALPSGYKLVFVRCTDHVWINWGTGAVTASAASTSQLHPAGESVQVVPTGATYIAVLRVGSTDVPVQVEGCAIP